MATIIGSGGDMGAGGGSAAKAAKGANVGTRNVAASNVAEGRMVRNYLSASPLVKMLLRVQAGRVEKM